MMKIDHNWWISPALLLVLLEFSGIPQHPLFLLSHAMMGVEPLVLVDFKGLKNLIFHWSNLARSVKHLEIFGVS